MGLFDEYLTGLEGKDDLDPLSLAKELHEIHTKEIGIREAKINELSTTVQSEIEAKAKLETDLNIQKARNYDLAHEIPGMVLNAPRNDVPDPGSITVDDLFKKKGS